MEPFDLFSMLPPQWAGTILFVIALTGLVHAIRRLVVACRSKRLRAGAELSSDNEALLFS